jgi:HSP20 family protein
MKTLNTAIEEFRNYIPAFFDDFITKEWLEYRLPSVMFPWIKMPAVNIKDTSEWYCFEVAAPGLLKGDFKVEVDKHILRITIDSSYAKENADANFIQKEFCCKTFDRTFTLPETVDVEKIKASYVDGLLKINIPKKIVEASQPKTVKVA